jgi:methylenetetrahydrofolate reductase (NADPH)
MIIKDLWNDREKPTISFELFPPRDQKAAGKLDKVIDKLTALQPDFISVTFGAGGSTRDGSFELANKLKTEKNLEVLTYVAAYGLAPDALKSILDNYKSIGIDSVLCVRGDEPDGIEDFKTHPDSFSYASDFLEFTNKNYDFFCGAAAYPEGHKDAENPKKDLEFLKLKVEKGANFIITQYVYDNRYFFDFVKRCRDIGINVPIIAGVMPIYSIKMMENLASICGASITGDLRNQLAQLPTDEKNAVTQFGIEFALKQCKELIAHGVDGIHFYTMDRSKTITEVIRRLKEEALL